MTDDERIRMQMRDILKGLRFESMNDAVYAVKWLLHFEEVHGHSCMNDILRYRKKDTVLNGECYGWTNLRNDILKNKYGAAAIPNIKTKKTEFILRLPPVEKLSLPEIKFGITEEGLLYASNLV